MKILIIGAGISGMTLAALLEQRGLTATVVERAPNFEHAGYMLGLWPLGYRVLHGLSLYDRFASECIAGNYYEVRDNRGKVIKRWNLAPISKRFGPNLSCTRPQLVKLLHSALASTSVQFETSIERLVEMGDQVEAHFSDGSRDTFDLVIGADGMNSRTRHLVFDKQSTFDTEWGGWVWWAPLNESPPETFVEHWGIGRFLGGYPTRDGVGVFAGAYVDGKIDQVGPGRRERILERFGRMGDFGDAWLETLPEDDASMYFWRMADVRSAEWVRGRVVLLGDAAAGFLPTAGIGASMAMESAAVLADELSRTDARSVPLSLNLYEKRRRRRVERVQDDSRRLAKLMFVRSPALAWLRDRFASFYSIEQLGGSIAKTFEEPI